MDAAEQPSQPTPTLDPPPSDIVATEPVTTAPSEGSKDVFVVNGETVTPETHRFKDGKPVIGKNGNAMRRPGPSKGASYKPVQTVVVAAPAPAPVPVPAAAPTTATTLATTAVVTRTFGKIGAPEISDEKLEVRTFVTAPASVEIGYGLTLNIGNYESARIDVKLSVPCYREEADEAFAFARKWAEERVQQEVKEVRKIASGTKGNNTPF